jgi:hypothetical protein
MLHAEDTLELLSAGCKLFIFRLQALHILYTFPLCKHQLAHAYLVKTSELVCHCAVGMGNYQQNFKAFQEVPESIQRNHGCDCFTIQGYHHRSEDMCNELVIPPHDPIGPQRMDRTGVRKLLASPLHYSSCAATLAQVHTNQTLRGPYSYDCMGYVLHEFPDGCVCALRERVSELHTNGGGSHRKKKKFR